MIFPTFCIFPEENKTNYKIRLLRFIYAPGDCIIFPPVAFLSAEKDRQFEHNWAVDLSFPHLLSTLVVGLWRWSISSSVKKVKQKISRYSVGTVTKSISGDNNTPLWFFFWTSCDKHFWHPFRLLQIGLLTNNGDKRLTLKSLSSRWISHKSSK